MVGAGRMVVDDKFNLAERTMKLGLLQNINGGKAGLFL